MYQILTFNLPDSVDKVLQGAGTRGVVGTTLNESLPNIKGSLAVNANVGSAYFTGAFYGTDSEGQGYSLNAITQRRTGFNASLSSSTYQDNAPVQPDALCITYIIKF